MKAKTPRFVELVRVSTSGQVEKDTPEIQRRALDKLAASRPGVRVERIEELGVSGAAPLDQRPAIARLRALTEARAYDEVRVWALDRITRSEDPADRLVVLSLCKEAGATIVEANGREVDPADEMGEMSYYLSTFFAAQERRRFSARTKAGRAKALAEGKYLGGIGAPYGFRWDKPSEKWTVDEERAAIVRRIFAAAATGSSTVEITATLNAEGVASPGAARWHQSNVARMLRWRAYIGEWSYSSEGVSYPIALPAIVDRETFDRVSFGLTARLTRPTKCRSIEALVRGLALCGTCGRAMRVETIHANKKRYAYYICGSARVKGERCENISHRADKVDAAVWSAVSERLRDPELLREALEARDSVDDGPTWEAQIAGCDSRLDALTGFEKEQMRLRRRGLISAEAYETALTEIKTDRETLLRSRGVAESGITSRKASKRALQTAQERVQALGAAIDGAGFAERRELLQALVPMMPGYGVTLHREGRIEIRGALEDAPSVRHRHSPVSADDLRLGTPVPVAMTARYATK